VACTHLVLTPMPLLFVGEEWQLQISKHCCTQLLIPTLVLAVFGE